MWSPFTGAKTPYKDHPEDVGTHVLDAYALLCNANRRGIQVPSDVVSTITQARAAAKAGTLEGELETKFWNAYGLLSSSIEALWYSPEYKIIVLSTTYVNRLTLQYPEKRVQRCARLLRSHSTSPM